MPSWWLTRFLMAASVIRLLVYATHAQFYRYFFAMDDNREISSFRMSAISKWKVLVPISIIANLIHSTVIHAAKIHFTVATISIFDTIKVRYTMTKRKIKSEITST
jgi:hypothetical protein